MKLSEPLCCTPLYSVMQVLNGEEYPPYQKDVNITMYYLPQTPQHLRFALGHPFFALLPGNSTQYTSI